jgi:hypothetical protein
LKNGLTQSIQNLSLNKKKTFKNPNELIEFCWKSGHPYGGTIGGGLTYSFTPTSVGIVLEVTYFGRKLDLTRYEEW